MGRSIRAYHAAVRAQMDAEKRGETRPLGKSALLPCPSKMAECSAFSGRHTDQGPGPLVPYVKCSLDRGALVNALRFYGLSLGLPMLGGIAGHLGGSKLSAMFTKSMPQRAWVDVVLNKHRSA